MDEAVYVAYALHLTTTNRLALVLKEDFSCFHKKYTT